MPAFTLSVRKMYFVLCDLILCYCNLYTCCRTRLQINQNNKDGSRLLDGCCCWYRSDVSTSNKKSSMRRLDRVQWTRKSTEWLAVSVSTKNNNQSAKHLWIFVHFWLFLESRNLNRTHPLTNERTNERTCIHTQQLMLESSTVFYANTSFDSLILFWMYKLEYD